MRDRSPQGNADSNQHPVLIFAVVAVFTLIPLILFARFASGETDPPAPVQVDAATVATTEPGSAAPVSGSEPSPAEPADGDWSAPAIAGAAPAPVPGEPPLTPTSEVEATTAPSEEIPGAPALAAEVEAAAEPAPAPAPFVPAPATAQFIPAPPTAPAPPVDAEAYVVLERSCGAILAGQNERQRMAPASLTKIVTALVVHRRADLNTMVDVEVSGSQMAKRGSSVMGLEPGMRLSVIDLLYGLFLPSGNDAALTLAGHVGGDTNRFVSLMNSEAARLGLYDTHFANPHGLDARGHYSTAFDMALAGRAFLNEPLLAQISVTPEYQPDWPNGLLKNGNKLLRIYPGSFGVKIGYTTAAKQAIVAAAERNGRQVIVSLIKSEDRYTDSIALFDWAFKHTSSACPPI
jgi:D-alanyl-D-alanine carboxypeptidase